MSRFYKNETFKGWVTVFAMFAGLLFALFYSNSEKYYFPSFDVSVVDEKTGEVIKDGLVWACWDGVKTLDSIIVLPKDGKFHVPKKVYYGFFKGFIGGATGVRFGFCNPYYLASNDCMLIEKEFSQSGSDKYFLYRGKTIFWDFIKNKGIKPPVLQTQLKTKHLKDTMDMKFYDNGTMQTVIDFSYLSLAEEACIKYELQKIKDFWFDYIKTRCGNDTNKYQELLNIAKDHISFYINLGKKLRKN